MHTANQMGKRTAFMLTLIEAEWWFLAYHDTITSQKVCLTPNYLHALYLKDITITHLITLHALNDIWLLCLTTYLWVCLRRHSIKINRLGRHRNPWGRFKLPIMDGKVNRTRRILQKGIKYLGEKFLVPSFPSILLNEASRAVQSSAPEDTINN